MMNIKIQSMTDVITNSSTSVFCVYEPQNMITIKNLVNSILAISGEYNFDDLFDIEFSYSYSEISYFLKIEKGIPYTDQNKFMESLSREDFNAILKEASEFDGYKEYDKFDFCNGIKVTVKPGINSEKAEKAAKLISQIDSIFDLDYSCD